MKENKDGKLLKDGKKPRYKKQQSGIYNKKKQSNVYNKKKKNAAKGKGKAQDQKKAKNPKKVDELALKAQQAALSAEQSATAPADVAPAAEKSGAWGFKRAQSGQPDMTSYQNQSKSVNQSKLMMQAALAAAFIFMGAVLLVSTILFIYQPMQKSNKELSDQRLKTRMELNLIISQVFPSMNVDDEMTDMVLRALENKKSSLRAEGIALEKEIKNLRDTDEQVAALLTELGYENADFSQIVSQDSESSICINAINGKVGVIDARLEELGVAKLQEEITKYKGTTTTVTREDENGETITETVTTGGLLPEIQAKKNELQTKYDTLQAQLDALEEYIHDNQRYIVDMYDRLEDAPEAEYVYDKMNAITAYVKANPEDNIFLQDTLEKLESFPGESKEEDDILFMMKIESETGIRMQTINYGQDYQHTKLSNGMLLCYEVYSIPYYATYEGLKNLIAYFNDNDDFYASVYTLSIQYNALNQTLMGNIVILHYYLLEDGAEYIPPELDEVINTGVDGIFGAGGSSASKGPQSDYTPEDIERWLQEDGLTLIGVRDKLKSEGYPATELAWILKKKYKTSAEIQKFMEDYGGGEDYSTKESLENFFETDIFTLLEIYNTKLPEDNESEQPDDDDQNDDNQGGNNQGGNNQGGNNQGGSQSGKQSHYTAAKVEKMMTQDGMTLVQVRDQIKSEGYPAIELAWVLHEEYKTEDEVLSFMIRHGEINYLTIDQAAVLFECTTMELRGVYNS